MIDTHAHLYDERIFPRLDEVIDSARREGVEKIVTVGCDESSSKACVEIASREGIFATVGCHPQLASEYTTASEELYTELAKSRKVVAIGEIGLDYHYETSPRAVQKEVFEAQIYLAERLKLPVVLHIRDAYLDALSILEATRTHLDKVLLHCYSGDLETAKKFGKFDPYFAFGGVITFPNADKGELLSYLKERLVFETDCPYMAPVPHRGRVNEPKLVPLVYRRASMLIGESEGALTEIVDNNVKELFGI